MLDFFVLLYIYLHIFQFIISWLFSIVGTRRKVFCVAMFTITMFALTGCGGSGSATVVNPPLDIAFTGRAVDWDGRAISYRADSASFNHNSRLLQGGSANLGHVHVRNGTSPEVTIRFDLPREINEVRVLGNVAITIQKINPRSTGQRMIGNTHTLNFANIRGNSGVILIWAEGSAWGQTQSGYFSVTFERVDRLPGEGPVIRPGPPGSGRESNWTWTQINSIPSNFHGRYIANHAHGGGSVTVRGNSIVFHSVLAEMRIGSGATPDYKNTIFGEMDIASIHRGSHGEIHIRAWYRDSVIGTSVTTARVASMDINIGPGGLRVSNINTYMAAQGGNSTQRANDTIYRIPETVGNSDNSVQIIWVTVNATAALGDVIGGGQYLHGNLVELEAIAPAGMEAYFEGWYDADGTLMSRNRHLIIDAFENMQLEARFVEQIEQTATISTWSSIGGTTSGDGIFNVDSPTTVWATPDSGWEFDGWFENNTRINSNPTFTLTVTGNRNLEARFRQQQTLTATISAWASVGGTTYGDGAVNLNTTATVWAFPDFEWEFDGWFEGNNRVSSDPAFTFVATSDRFLEARFRQVLDGNGGGWQNSTITITTWTSGGGTMSAGGTFIHDEPTTMWAQPNAGWEFVGWFEDGNFLTENLTQLFHTRHDRTIEARFSQQQAQTVTISTWTSAGGATSGDGVFNINTSQIVWATPNHGWEFDGWFDGNARVSSNQSFTFTTTNNRTLEARFRQQQSQTANISTWSSGGGTASGDGIVNLNASTTVWASPSAGWEFEGWFEGNTRVNSSQNFTFTVTNERTLEARFIQQQSHTTFISTWASAGGTVFGGGLANINSQSTVWATPNDGWEFDGWFEGNTRVGSSETFTFTATNDRNLEARFRQLTAHRINLFIGFPEMDTPSGRVSIDASNTTPVIRDGRTLLPVRAIIEEMGGDVEWVPNGGGNGWDMVVVNVNGYRVQMIIGHDGFYVNGNRMTFDVSPQIINGRTMLPARALFEAVGFTVNWVPNGGGDGWDMVTISHYR